MFSKAFLTTGTVALATSGLVMAAPLTNDEVKALDFINHARRAINKHALTWDIDLKADAEGWAKTIAVAGSFEYAPASDRKGAGEVISILRSENPKDPRMTHPITESAKNWLTDDIEVLSVNDLKKLSLSSAQLLAGQATRIGCASSAVKGATAQEHFQYTVCRVHADISDTYPVVRRQNMSKGPFTGDITFFNPGLGACGQVDNDNSMIVALSHLKMGAQSNGNPLCGKKVRISAEGKSIIVTVTDKCMGCGVNDVDVSPAAFTQLLGNLGRGRVPGVKWEIL